jgi:hypothetical protein
MFIYPSVTLIQRASKQTRGVGRSHHAGLRLLDFTSNEALQQEALLSILSTSHDNNHPEEETIGRYELYSDFMSRIGKILHDCMVDGVALALLNVASIEFPFPISWIGYHHFLCS